jgi:cyclic pyranopterin phosphate synthase
MQDEEILRLTSLFAGLGFDKIRLTGGEPTLRENVVALVHAIAATPGIRGISMTTNGVLLADLAGPLAAAGLQRVNISLDTLDPVKFKNLTCIGNVEDVWNGIIAGEQAGLQPIKLNVVVMQGYNEQDAVDLARLTIDHPWQVRFIEMMPF